MREDAERLLAAFRSKCLPFDLDAGEWFALVVSGREAAGHPISAADAQIAAICLARGARLATRNVKDFLETGVSLINPWEAD